MKAFGFWAKPEKKADGTLDLTKWTAGVPGKEGTIWQGGLYKLRLVFPTNFPAKVKSRWYSFNEAFFSSSFLKTPTLNWQPPTVSFTPPLFHPNVYDDGKICLSIINDYQDWKPSINVKQILLGVQDLLDTPNPNSPANGPANKLFTREPEQYKEKIKKIAAANKPVDDWFNVSWV
jgi:ubiquitin-conjugating enzyme E2 I